MQQRQVEKVTNNINYLQAQIEQTSIAEMQEVFYNIIEEQTKNKMLAEASPDYVFCDGKPKYGARRKITTSAGLNLYFRYSAGRDIVWAVSVSDALCPKV